MFCFPRGSKTSRHWFASSWVCENTNIRFWEKSRLSDQATNKQRVGYTTTNSVKFSLSIGKCHKLLRSAVCGDVCQNKKWIAGCAFSRVWVSSPVRIYKAVNVNSFVLGRKFHIWAKLLYFVTPLLKPRFYPVIARLTTQLRYNRNSIASVLKLWDLSSDFIMIKLDYVIEDVY